MTSSTVPRDTDYPRTWDWATDGDTVEGRYVRVESGQTKRGPRPILVLEVEGEERSVWIFGSVLTRELSDELKRRGSKEFTPGETIRIFRAPELTTGQDGTTTYRKARATFPDAPNSTAAEILDRAASGPSEPESSQLSADDDLPY